MKRTPGTFVSTANEAFTTTLRHLVSLLLGHISGFVKLIKIMMCGSAQGTQLVICEACHRNIGVGMNTDIGITFRISGTNIEHGLFAVIMIDTVRTSIYNRAAAVRAAHLTYLESYVNFGRFIRTHGIITDFVMKTAESSLLSAV